MPFRSSPSRFCRSMLVVVALVAGCARGGPPAEPQPVTGADGILLGAPAPAVSVDRLERLLRLARQRESVAADRAPAALRRAQPGEPRHRLMAQEPPPEQAR
jgi:hypothetical protein